MSLSKQSQIIITAISTVAIILILLFATSAILARNGIDFLGISKSIKEPISNLTNIDTETPELLEQCDKIIKEVNYLYENKKWISDYISLMDLDSCKIAKTGKLSQELYCQNLIQQVQAASNKNQNLHKIISKKDYSRISTICLKDTSPYNISNSPEKSINTPSSPYCKEILQQTKKLFEEVRWISDYISDKDIADCELYLTPYLESQPYCQALELKAQALHDRYLPIIPPNITSSEFSHLEDCKNYIEPYMIPKTPEPQVYTPLTAGTYCANLGQKVQTLYYKRQLITPSLSNEEARNLGNCEYSVKYYIDRATLPYCQDLKAQVEAILRRGHPVTGTLPNNDYQHLGLCTDFLKVKFVW